MSKAIKGVTSFGGKKKRRGDSAKNKKRTNSKKAHLNASAESMFSPKNNAFFNNKKLSYTGNNPNSQISDAISRHNKKKVYSRNQGMTGVMAKDQKWGGSYGSRFRTH